MVLTDQTSIRFASDHLWCRHILLPHSFPIKVLDIRTSLNFYVADTNEVNERYFLDQDLTSVFTSYNVDSILSKLKDIIIHECIQFVPLYKRRKSICPRWSNAEVKHTLKPYAYCKELDERSSSRAFVSKQESLEKMFETIVSTRAKYNLYLVNTFSSNLSKLYPLRLIKL